MKVIDILYDSKYIMSIRKRARDLFGTENLLRLTEYQLEVLKEMFQIQELV